MISTKLLLYLSIGTTAMLLPVLLQAKWQGLKLWKGIVLALLLTVMGTVGTYILYFVENGWIGGTSFYGAVFFVPIPFLLIAKMFRRPYHQIMDLCAPAECAMLMVMKVQCLLGGCCVGRVLFSSSGGEIRFPSQIAELVNALILLIVLLILARKKPGRGDLYPLYMVLYGASRFVLNTLRENSCVFLLGMPAGHFWSVVSALVGLLWLMLLRKKEKAQA